MAIKINENPSSVRLGSLNQGDMFYARDGLPYIVTDEKSATGHIKSTRLTTGYLELRSPADMVRPAHFELTEVARTNADF